jgi:type VI secretion system protein
MNAGNLQAQRSGPLWGLFLLRAWVVCLAFGLLAGCGAMSAVTSMVSSVMEPKPAAPDWKSLVITATVDANQNSPIAVDVVFVKDKAMVAALLATSSSKWFATRADLLRSFGESLEVSSFELMPSQSIRLDAKALSGNLALATLVFADYPTPGEHRERLQMATPGYVVQLGAKGFQAAEVKTP